MLKIKNCKSPFLLLLLALGFQFQVEAQEQHENEQAEHSDSVSNKPFYRLDSQRTWPFFSFLEDKGDDAQTLGLELESHLNIGPYNVKNISYFEVNSYPRVIPGQPVGSPGNADQSGAANGINDLLTAFWFSKSVKHHEKDHGKHHFTLGFAAQLPTATDKTLGSGKWSAGPSFDYEFESGRWFAGAIALQIWSFAGESDRKAVNMLMIKPFVAFNVFPRFDLIYMPYGISVYRNKPEGEKVYLPLGGGAQYQFPLGKETTLNLGIQFFEYVIRPTNGTVYDLRFLIEFIF